MGVDFSLDVVKKVGDKIVPVSGKNVSSISCRYHYLSPIFRDYKKKMERLLGHKISSDFYEVVNSSVYADSKDKSDSGENVHFDPNVVLNSLKSIIKVLKLNEGKFPVYYWFFKKDKENGSSTQHVFIEGQATWLDGGFNNCYYTLKNKKIDISKLKEIGCNELINKKKNSKWVEIEGDEIIFEIKKETFYEYFKLVFDDMIKVCNFAKNKGYYVQGVMW